MKKVSIIIRTKNEENWIKACLQAILNQNYLSFEIIIVDNGSKDRTVDVVKKFGIKKITTLESFTPGAALQKGINISKGDILVFLSAHCIPTSENWLYDLVKPIIDYKSVASYGRQIPTKSSGPDDARDLLMVFGKENLIQSKDFKFHNANSAIDKEYYLKNPFDKNLSNIEDWDWGKKVIKNKKTISYIADASVYHHHGINQHNINESFRSKSVSKILRELYEIENLNPSFENYLSWKGLLIISASSINEKKIIKQIKSIYRDTMDIIVTSHYKFDNNLIVSKKLSFQDYLFTCLKHGEKSNKIIYDYIVFIDLHFQNIALNDLNKPREVLFRDMVDCAVPARELNSFIYNQNLSKETRVNNNSRVMGEIYELVIGQGGAFRTSIIRRKILDKSNISISNKLDREYSFKHNWNDS
jgi:glycosyltransferase involved in cell wall biosynthesis